MVPANRITDLQQGQPYTLITDLGLIPDGFLIQAARLNLNYSQEGPLLGLATQIDITANLTSAGQVTDTGSDGLGAVKFIFPTTSSTATKTFSLGGGATLNISAARQGACGNLITFRTVDPATINAALTLTQAWGTTGLTITASLATDGAGTPTSTVAHLLAAITADATISSLIVGGSTGSIATVLPPLSGTLTGGNLSTTDLQLRNYYYEILAQLTVDGPFVVLKAGEVVVNNPHHLATTSRSLTTTATPLQSYSPRVNKIINSYVDAILHDFRQLQVWDERGHRSAHDPGLLLTAYQNWNTAFTPEVFDIQNNRVNANLVAVDYSKGAVRITGDTGHNDYFITYRFDLFPAPDLQALLELTLQEINLMPGPTPGSTYQTSYGTVDEAPLTWDAPLTYGVVAKAFRRLAMDSGIWKNSLIWTDPANGGAALANQAAEYYSTIFTSTAGATKTKHYISLPTSSWLRFSRQGVGGYVTDSTRFRELTISRMPSWN